MLLEWRDFCWPRIWRTPTIYIALLYRHLRQRVVSPEAIHQVLRTSELLGAILRELPCTILLRVQRECKLWLTTIQASKPLREALFLAPVDSVLENHVNPRRSRHQPGRFRLDTDRPSQNLKQSSTQTPARIPKSCSVNVVMSSDDMQRARTSTSPSSRCSTLLLRLFGSRSMGVQSSTLRTEP